MRVMQDSAAEKEADRLSRGVTSQTPDGLMAEMGSRLGADFSGVTFHSDTTSMNRSKALGARAWAQGSDVHFGKGGFDPKIAAHELVHTVQQGAVQGNVSRSVPNGSVQLFSGEDDNAIQRRQNIPANASNLELMTQQKNSSDYGRQLFINLKKPIKKFAESGGSRVSAVNEDNGILYLANLGERDYSGKEILRDIATRSVINKDERYERTDEYEGFLDYMKDRTDKVGLETVAMQTQVLDGNPRFEHAGELNINKRAYEMTEQELADDTINPTHDAEVGAVLKKIDDAQNAKDAFFAFFSYTNNREYTRQDIDDPRIGMAFANSAQVPVAYGKNAQGNNVKLSETEVEQRKQQLVPIEARIADAQNRMEINKQYLNYPKNNRTGRAFKSEYDKAKADLDAANAQKEQVMVRYRYQVGADINVPLFKAKLKNMVRQVRDYPELKHKYNGINIQWNQENGNQRDITNKDVMAVSPSPGGRETATIHYDAFVDRDTPEGLQERTEANEALSRGIGHLDKVGNHEQGHILESTLNPTVEDQNAGTASNDILNTILPNVLNPQEMQNVHYYQQSGKNARDKYVLAGQVDTTSDIFKTRQLTSPYGQTNSKELFAEAFHDVYTKGADAKPTSIEIVKEYEKRQTEKQKAGFKKKQRGFFGNIFTKIGRFFGRMVNFGASHNAPQQAAPNAVANPMAAMPDLNNINVDPNAGVPQVNNAAADPGQADDPLSHYADNLLHDTNPIRQLMQQQENEEDPLNQSMITERPKRRNLRKKKKH